MKTVWGTWIVVILSSCALAEDKPMPLTDLETRPGVVRWVTFAVRPGEEDALFVCRDQAIKHTKWKDDLHQAYVAESYFAEEGSYTCTLGPEGKSRPVVRLTVKPFKFPEERLRVDFRKIKLSPKDQARAEKEQLVLNALYKKSAPTPYFTVPFKAPLDSTVTSIYGTRRVYNKQHRSQHLGTDFRAAIGVQVPAANRGRVMFAGDLFYTGGTVIIDHGMDIFTVYGHLSEVKTTEGQVVNQGDVVGLSGNTGRSSGPHLHWGVKIHGSYVDGYSLVEETRRQFP